MTAASSLVRVNVVGSVGDDVRPQNQSSDAPPAQLSAGSEAAPPIYRDALERLETVPQIDLVTASVDYRGADENLVYADSTRVASMVRSHCENMSAIARNRIGFSQIPDHGAAKPAMGRVLTMASTLTSDRMVLIGATRLFGRGGWPCLFIGLF